MRRKKVCVDPRLTTYGNNLLKLYMSRGIKKKQFMKLVFGK